MNNNSNETYITDEYISGLKLLEESGINEAYECKIIILKHYNNIRCIKKIVL